MYVYSPILYVYIHIIVLAVGDNWLLVMYPVFQVKYLRVFNDALINQFDLKLW